MDGPTPPAGWGPTRSCCEEEAEPETDPRRHGDWLAGLKESLLCRVPLFQEGSEPCGVEGLLCRTGPWVGPAPVFHSVPPEQEALCCSPWTDPQARTYISFTFFSCNIKVKPCLRDATFASQFDQVFKKVIVGSIKDHILIHTCACPSRSTREDNGRLCSPWTLWSNSDFSKNWKNVFKDYLTRALWKCSLWWT